MQHSTKVFTQNFYAILLFYGMNLSKKVLPKYLFRLFCYGFVSFGNLHFTFFDRHFSLRFVCSNLNKMNLTLTFVVRQNSSPLVGKSFSLLVPFLFI